MSIFGNKSIKVINNMKILKHWFNLILKLGKFGRLLFEIYGFSSFRNKVYFVE
jgi:hypothetical protein